VSNNNIFIPESETKILLEDGMTPYWDFPAKRSFFVLKPGASITFEKIGFVKRKTVTYSNSQTYNWWL
jgi:hypothetical protein